MKLQLVLKYRSACVGCLLRICIAADYETSGERSRPQRRNTHSKDSKCWSNIGPKQGVRSRGPSHFRAQSGYPSLRGRHRTHKTPRPIAQGRAASSATPKEGSALW